MSPVPYLGFTPGTAEYTRLDVRVVEDEFPRLGLGYTLGSRMSDVSSYRVGPCPLGALRVCYQARKNNDDASAYRVRSLSPRSP